MFLQVEPRNRNTFISQSPTIPGVILSHRPLENINIILQSQAGMGALFLGDVVSTLKDNVLEMNRIKAILTCMTQNHQLSGKNIIHKVIAIKDTLEYPISMHFNEAGKWIQEKRRQGINVLVHCHAGVSRSATIVTAYLMRYKGWTAVQALNYVRSKRARAKPNANFWNQLTQYQLTLNNQKEEQRSTEGKLLYQSKLTQHNDPQSPTRQYRRRKIFQNPPIEQNHNLRQKNVFSTQCLPLSHHYQKQSQSIIFNNHNRSEIYENKSAVQPRMINNSFIISQSRILTPPIQGQTLSNSPSINHLHYNSHYIYKQKAVSPFELDYSRTH